MKSVRRSIAGLAAAALTTTGLSVLSMAIAPEAHAAGVSVDDAVFRWGINTEASSAAFAPGHWNLASAGKVGNPGAGGQRLNSADDGATWSPNAAAAGWTNQSGNVTIEDLQTGGTYAPTTFLGTRQNAAGVTGTTGNGVSGETQLVFRNGTGTVDAAANTASIQWDGDASILYYSGLTFFYLSDPELTVAADGSGAVTATVDGYAADMVNTELWTDLPETEVTLATLTGVDVETLGLTTTPSYRGVEYTATGSATPQSRTGENWGAFPQSFVDFQQLTGGSSYWYSSGGGADVRKPTLPLTVAYDASPPPAVQVSRTEFLASGSAEVTVTGTGFRPSLATGTRPPLAGKPAGAYVVFGKFAEDWKPSAAAPAANRKNTSQKWAVLAADMGTIGGPNAGAVELHPDGSFEATVTVDKAAIDAVATGENLVNYGIYTYPGSGAVQPLYETYTPVTFAKADSTVSATVTKVPTPNATGTAKVAVAPEGDLVATGAISAQVKNAGGSVVATLPGTLDDTGSTTLTLPKLAPGKHTITATYVGTDNIAANNGTASFTVAKVAAVFRSGWTRKPTAIKAGGIRIRVTGTGTGVGAGTGTLTVQVKNTRGKVVKTVKAKIDATGLAKVPLPKLKAGKYALVTSYAGNTKINTGKLTVRFTSARR